MKRRQCIQSAGAHGNGVLNAGNASGADTNALIASNLASSPAFRGWGGWVTILDPNAPFAPRRFERVRIGPWRRIALVPDKVDADRLQRWDRSNRAVGAREAVVVLLNPHRTRDILCRSYDTNPCF